MYPYFLLSRSVSLSCIFWDSPLTIPSILDYSASDFQQIDPRDQDAIESYNMKLLQAQNSTWALGGYLEDRSYILTDTHIRSEWRIFHLGIDVVFPAGTPLYAPLPGKVYESWYEPWNGNYGGYIIIEHFVEGSSFFALYGHLSHTSIITKGTVDSGEKFAELGTRSENGNWFEHLHLQVFTGRDIEKWKNKWYCSLADLPTIKNYCPDPSFLIRY